MNPRLQRIVRRTADDDLLVAFTEARRRSANEESELPGNALAITSAASREGKTHVAVRLAVQNARIHGRRTLIVDAAPQRRGCATRLVGTSNRGSAGSGEVPAPVCAATGLPGLDLLTWGPQLRMRGRDGSSVGAPLSEVLDGVSSGYDLVVLDAGSMADGPSVPGMLRCASRVLFVVEHRRLSAGQIRSYIDRIDTPPILGVVLNKRRYPIPDFIYRRL